MSIQQCIEEKLSLLQRQTVNVVGAGRTDAGVHARMMAAHFDSEQPIDDLAGLTAKLNLLLPYDIAIERIIQVKENAHARFDALSRTYQYYVSDRKSAFNHEWVCRMPLQGMDFTQMNRACHILTEYTDFTSFSKLHTDVKTNICLIESAEWQQEGSIWIFTIKADRFLRNMVRAIVGTLFEVGRGKCSLDGFRQIIEARNRCNAGTSVSAKGLALVDITYPEELFDIV